MSGDHQDRGERGAARCRERLREALRLIVITDRALAGARGVEAVVDAALRGGARAIQVRDKGGSARDTVALARALRASTRAAGALLFVNDRLDVALASGADGVHLGPDDLPVDAVRAVVPRAFLVGYSTDDPTEARHAEARGADYLGCGALWPTSSKNVGDEAIGIARLDEVARAVDIPVVGIGGVTPEGAEAVAGTAAAGVAVLGAVMSASDPEAVVRALMAPFEAR